MIRVKLIELNAALTGFRELSETALPVKAAYWVSKNMKKVLAELQDFEASRVKLATKHAKTNDDGSPMTENGLFVFVDADAFGREFAELASIEAEFDFPALILEQLGDIQIKPVTILNLGPFVQE